MHRQRTSDEVTFGQLIGSYRVLRANISQRKVASFIGISEIAYRKWESDQSKPEAHHFQRLLEVFLELGMLTPRKEEEEARELWKTSKANVIFAEVWTNALTNARKPKPEKEGHLDATPPQLLQMSARAEMHHHDTSKMKLPNTDQDTAQLETANPMDKEVAEGLHLLKRAYGTDLANTTEEDKDMDAKKRNSIQQIGTVVRGSLLLNYVSVLQPLGFGQRGWRLHDEEILDICKTEIPIWWRLYYEGYHAEIRKVLPSHLFQLSTLAVRPSRYQQRAGNLASQAHQLAHLLALHQQDFSAAQMHAQQAFQYGVIAEDFNLQTSALLREGYIYYCVNDPESMLYVYQRAFQYRKKVLPLQQGRTYNGLAKTHAFLKQEQEADHFLGLTRDTYPEHPEYDPAYPYIYWDSFSRNNFEVMTYLQLNQPRNAWQACEKMANTPSLHPTKRVEFLVRQAETSFALGEMGQCCSHIEQAVIAALKLGSDMRYQEAYNLYSLMLDKWHREKDVQELAELFPRQERIVSLR